jgi:hypothetical protein
MDGIFLLSRMVIHNRSKAYVSENGIVDDDWLVTMLCLLFYV